MSVEIPVGIKNAAFKRGLDEMRSQAKGFQRELAGGNPLASIGKNLGAALSLGGIAAGIHGLIEKFSKLEEMSKKFGTSAVTLQKLEGAAKLDDVELGALAKTMAKLTVAADKSAKSTKHHADKFKELGIDARSFADADMDKKLLMLSEAYERANVNGDGAHKILSLLGAKGAAIIPLLARGPQKLNEEMAKTPALGDEAVQQMKALGDTVKQVENTFVSMGVSIAKTMTKAGAYVGWLWNYMVGNAADAGEVLKEQLAEIDQQFDGKADMKQTGAGGKDADDAQEDLRTKERIAKLEDDIADKERKNRLDALDEEDRLNAMYEERDRLLKQANDTTEEGLEADEERASAKKAALELEDEAAKLSEKIQNDREAKQKKIADRELKESADLKRAREEERDQAEKNQLDAMDPKARVAALMAKATKLAKEAKDLDFRAENTVWNSDVSHDKEAETRMKTEAAKKRLEARKLQGEIASLTRKEEDSEKEKKSRGPQFFASHLAEVGGGGHAAAHQVADRQLAELKGIRKALDKLAGTDGRSSAPRSAAAFSGHVHGSNGLRTGGLLTGRL